MRRAFLLVIAVLIPLLFVSSLFSLLPRVSAIEDAEIQLASITKNFAVEFSDENVLFS